ncbi:MAG: hypothetical protein KJ626_00625 [Verrucomicrobia bacterium]|nr:hypothetical protein [Verrucomicrobiota bacterium]
MSTTAVQDYAQAQWPMCICMTCGYWSHRDSFGELILCPICRSYDIVLIDESTQFRNETDDLDEGFESPLMPDRDMGRIQKEG